MKLSKYIKEFNLIGNLLIISIFFLTGYVYSFESFSFSGRSHYLEFLLVLNIAWIISAYINKIHDISRVAPFEIVFRRYVKAVLLYLLLLLSYLGLSGQQLEPSFILKSYLLISTGLTIFHFSVFVGLKYWRRLGNNYKRIIIVGHSELSEELRNFFVYHPEHGYRFMGFFDDDKEASHMIKGDMSDVEAFAMSENIDEIYCCMPDIEYTRMQSLVRFADRNFIKLKVIPDFRGFPYKSLDIQLYDYIPVLKLGLLPLDSRFNQTLKRVFDIGFALSFILLIYSWLYPLLALLIRLDSKGPILFKQTRTGENNRAFTCYKFRTMKVNVEADTKQATKDDPRVTRIGKFLRKTSLDELPQFVNVLKGEMSIIGPRPHPLKLNADFSPVIDKFMMRHAVKPGITGLAQAKGFRGETSTLKSMQDRVRLDRFYVENWSFFLDIKILFMTAKSLLADNEKAY